MLLSDCLRLLKDFNLVQDAAVAGLTYDSRTVRPGDAFIAISGERFDGHDFVEAAIRGGAAAVVVSKPVCVPPGTGLAYVGDTRRAMPHIGRAFFGDPMRDLIMVGITGTKGKTTTCHLIKSVLDACGEKTGLIGTVHNIIGQRELPVTHTTPESLDIQRLLKEMLEEGCTAATMEVSSHALALCRVDGIMYDAAVLTNIGRDHLDYHKTMDEYVNVKSRLFSMFPSKGIKKREVPNAAVLNADDAYVQHFAVRSGAQVVTYGLSPLAEIRARDLEMSMTGTRFTLSKGSNQVPINLRLPGKFNVYNALAAAAVGLSLGFSMKDVARGLNGAQRVKGRAEVVPEKAPFAVWVDYAHTPESLKDILLTARSMTSNRVISVFGCGGDRDPGKRPIMGRISAQTADLTIITSDNPRSEDPERILDQIEEGIRDQGQVDYLRIQDRRQAIREAVRLAKPGDIVVLAGKGHETYQIIGNKKIHFDDVEEAAQAIRELAGI